MATNCIRSVTTDDGTKIDITVDGKNFRVEGSRQTLPIPPVDRWTLRQELAGVKLLVVGWGMGIMALLLLCTGAIIAFG